MRLTSRANPKEFHMLNATLNGTKLTIVIDCDTDASGKLSLNVSPSGKTRSIASSHGNQSTAIMVDGRPIVIGLNAYISNR